MGKSWLDDIPGIERAVKPGPRPVGGGRGDGLQRQLAVRIGHGS